MAAANGTMLILKGNADPDGDSYPDKNGKFIKWETGALHEQAAKDYAVKRSYDPQIIPAAGSTDEQMVQTRNAVMKDETVHALYGFSGGGYAIRHVLEYLKGKKKLGQINLVVVLGAPFLTKHPTTSGKKAFVPGYYGLKDDAWELVFRCNPPASLMPSGLPAGLDSHMFGPDVLLTGWAETDANCHESTPKK